MHDPLESFLANAYLKYKDEKGGFLKFDHSQCEESPKNDVELFWIDYSALEQGQSLLGFDEYTDFIVAHMDKAWPKTLLLFELRDTEDGAGLIELIGAIPIERLEKYWVENN